MHYPRQQHTKARLIRVAIGTQIYRVECSVTFTPTDRSLAVTYRKPKQSGRVTLAADSESSAVDRSNSKRLSKPVPIDLQGADDAERLASDNTVSETLTIRIMAPETVKFYLGPLNEAAPDDDDDNDDETQVIVLAITVSPDNVNGPTHFRSGKYQPSGDDLRRKHIVLELHSSEEFEDLRESMHLTEHSQLKRLDAEKRFGALKTYSNREKQRCLGQKKSYPLSRFLSGRGPNDTLLVYPIHPLYAGLDTEDVDRAADGLNELSESAARLSVSDAANPDSDVDEAEQKSNAESPENAEGTTARTIKEKPEGSVTLTTETFTRLDSGIYFNDNLVDFLCRWYAASCSCDVRSDPTQSNSLVALVRNYRTLRHKNKADFHLLSTFFYSALVKDGVASVAHYTMNRGRGVDVFAKKFTIVPGELRLVVLVYAFLVVAFATVSHAFALLQSTKSVSIGPFVSW